MAQLSAFILSYLLAAFFVVLGGTPFAPFVVIFLNFLITVPVAVALGFDKPASDLMKHTPRPLTQPILKSSQWVRIALIGILTAFAVVYLEYAYQGIDTVVAATMGFAVFGLMSVSMGLSARSETKTAFNRDIFVDKNQLMLYGIAIAVTYLSTELGFLQKLLGLTSLGRNEWWMCIAFAIGLLLVDEIIKSFMRRRKSENVVQSAVQQT
jgi:Ca2+-transporting ATPase